jgi:hypothetical protein
MPSLHKPALHRHLVSNSQQGLLRNILSHTADLKADLAGPDPGDPEFGLAFAFAHPRL